MEFDQVFNDVVSIIEGSIGKPKNEIKLADTLFDELGIDSIDLVDILFELETKYDIELKISDIESRAREQLGNQPYEIDGVITKEGLIVIGEFMTEIDSSKLKEGLTVHQFVQLFSVHSLCKIVLYRIDQESKKIK